MKIVSSLLAKHKTTLKVIAEELIQNGTLFQEDVAAILRRNTNIIKRKNGSHDNG